MPAVGKSTIGVLLAKATGRYFLDTDVYIQAIENNRLQNMIDSRGLEEFRRIEEERLISIDRKNAVIATGGSAVYSDAAMEHLRADGIIVHIDLPLDDIQQRLTDLPTRGVVMEPNQSISDLFEKRQPLYKRFADVTVNCSGLSHQQTLAATLKALNMQAL